MCNVQILYKIIVGLIGISNLAWAFGEPYTILPGSYGFGTETRAAYGGQARPRIFVVENLNASGSGSLREAIEASGPRVVVFEVSGVIEMAGTLSVDEPYLTIAGQTAPSPGVTLRQTSLEVRTHDVLVQHLRIRMDDGPGKPDYQNRDGVNVGSMIPGDTFNVVIDHCSVSWGIDEGMSVGGFADKVSFLNCIISESLYDSVHPDGPHSKGCFLNYRAGRVSLVGNLLIHNHERNPLSRARELVFANNIVYNYVNKAVELQNSNGIESKNTIVGNVFIRGRSTKSGTKPIFLRGGNAGTLLPESEVFVRDNKAEGYGGDDWDIVSNVFDVGKRVEVPPAWAAGLEARSVSGDEEIRFLMANGGARPLDRDEVDRRVVDDIREGTGKMINSPREVGGFPDLARNVRELAIPADPHGDDDGDGYTNLEEWLHDFSHRLEP